MSKETKTKSKVETTQKPTKSSQIIKHWKDGVEIGAIAKKMGIRYEFAYQVSKRFAQKNKLEFTTNRKAGETKADQIRKLYDDGKTVAEIVKSMPAGTNYTYVWSTVDAYRKSKV